MRTPFKERATPAVLTFLQETEVVEMVRWRQLEGGRGAEEDQVGTDGEDGGASPP